MNIPDCVGGAAAACNSGESDEDIRLLTPRIKEGSIRHVRPIAIRLKNPVGSCASSMDCSLRHALVIEVRNL